MTRWLNKNGIRGVGAALLTLALGAALPGETKAAAFSEPHTVFYGKVLGTASAQPFLIDQGDLTWRIRRPSGETVTLRASLFAYHDNQFSYRLNVPHSALALGLESSADDIPLPSAPAEHIHIEVKVDGVRATLLGPAASTFTLGQLQRTATFRLDLAMDRAPLDSDGDGIPDWWEDLHGLDKQDPGDASIDWSGDGLSALEAYRRGLDPHRDARMPALLTDELIVYPSGSTAVVLDTADLDSPPEDLVYTLEALALAGTLTLRNAEADPAAPDRGLTVGDTFTQADLLRGRVIYDHDGTDAVPGTFSLTVRDENPEHAADAGTVRLLAFRATDSDPPELPALQARRSRLYALAGLGYVILDADGVPDETAIANPSAGLDADGLADYRAAYGDDRPYAFSGGGDGVTLTGGHRDDILIATAAGGTLTGGPGADRFVMAAAHTGRVTIADFTPAEGDVLDLANLPLPAGANAHGYIRFADVGGVIELQLALSGDGASFTNLAVALPGLTLAQADLYELVAAGALAIGSLRLEPLLSVAATEPHAYQNGPAAGQFSLRRVGALTESLAVTVQFSGTALNGVDYHLLGTTVTFPAGVATRDIQVMPYVTDYQGPAKVVELTVAAGTGYSVGTAASAAVTIENLVPRVELDVLDPMAIMTNATPAVIRLRRREVTTGDVDVRLAYGGTAVAGVDYVALPTRVTLASGQTAVQLKVNPLPVDGGGDSVKTVTVTVVPDADYAIKTGAGSVTVSIDQSVAAMQPTAGATLDSRRPRFSWPAAAAGVSWHQLWITRNGASYAAPWVQGATAWIPGSDLPVGDYTWWVRGWSAATGHLPWSSPAHFTVPSLQPGTISQIAPEGAQASRDLVFIWDQTDRRATWFQLWVSRPGGGTWHDKWYPASAYDASAVAVDNHPGGDSSWWLRGWSPDGYGPWSGPLTFSTPSPMSSLPAKPTLHAPASGAVVSGPVSFDYAASNATWFRIYVSRDGSAVLDRWTQDTSLEVGVLSAGNYAWWVGSWNSETSTTVWSDRRTFSAP